MSEDKRYNGWTNYETWLANLWIDNDQGAYEYWREQAGVAMDRALDNGLEYNWPDWSYQRQAAGELAEEMKEIYEEAMDELKLDGFFADMLRGAMSEIYWREIAQHYTDDIKILSVGFNMPGYMPDSEPMLFVDWDQARDALVGELGRTIDELAEGEDASELEEAIDYLTHKGKANTEFGRTIGKYHYFLSEVK